MLNNVDKITFGTNVSNTNNIDSIPMNRVGVIGRGFANKEASGKLSGISSKQGPLLLNLGCGLDVREGFINIDLFSDNPNVVKMDVRKLDFPDNSVDFILASDVLEHFSHHQTDEVLAEWHRVLKPNATIIIRCPSLHLQVKAYIEKKWNADIASFMIFGGQSNPGDYHCIGFDEESMRNHLNKAGFEVLEFQEIDMSQDKGFINLNMTVKAMKIVGNQQSVSDSEKNTKKNQEFSSTTTNVLADYPNKSSTRSSALASQPQLNIVWEGSQFVYHSLALINREICKNIIDADVANLTIVPYETDTFSVNENPEYKKLHDNDIRYKADVSEEIGNLPYVWIRHQWPPKNEVPQGAKWIIMQPWEYSKFPEKFTKIFDQAVELWTPSLYSRNAFINSGIESDKVQVIPNGINPQLFKPTGDIYPLITKKRFKFLFIGGTTYRKGFDLLLQAYLATFKQENDVCLVVKDIGGNSFYKGQTLEAQIKDIQQNPTAPEIEYINDDLSEEQISALYRACDIFVSPYRGEGFSLPTLEAMASGLPVIVTRGGATDDFTTEENAWYINSVEKPITKTEADLVRIGATMLEPDIAELIQTLDYVAKVPTINFSQGLIGSYLARKNWTWKRTTMKVFERLDYLCGTEMSQNAYKILQDEDDEYIILGEAEFAFVNDNYNQAEQLYIIAVESGNLEDKYLVHCFNRLAQIAISNEQYISAYKYAEAAKTILPDNPDTTWISASILCAEEKYVEALELINPIVEHWLDYKYASSAGIDLEKHILLLGDILYLMGDLENSAQVYETALKINNYSPEACYGIAMCYKDSEMFEDARKMLEWAIEYKPDFERAKIELENLK